MNNAIIPTMADDLAEVRRAHDFDSANAPYQPEVLAFARAAQRIAAELERLRGEAVQPSAEGRADLVDKVSVYAHHSSLHPGINVEIDAPAGTRITVHLNDGPLADVVVSG